MNASDWVYEWQNAILVAVRIKVAEGLRIGKVSWCCDGFAHDATRQILAARGITECETMEESQARWEREGR